MVNAIVIPVSDLAAAKAVYGPLFGVEPHTDAPYYVGYNVDGIEMSLAPNLDQNGPVYLTDVPDIEAARKQLMDAGATEVSPVRDVGALVCVLADADGNQFGLRQGK